MTSKKRAYSIYNRAIKVGSIKRPDRCAACHRASMVHGHHHDYRKATDVVWLCNSCHRRLHACADDGFCGLDCPPDRLPFVSEQWGAALGEGAAYVRVPVSALRMARRLARIMTAERGVLVSIPNAVDVALEEAICRHVSMAGAIGTALDESIARRTNGKAGTA